MKRMIMGMIARAVMSFEFDGRILVVSMKGFIPFKKPIIRWLAEAADLSLFFGERKVARAQRVMASEDRIAIVCSESLGTIERFILAGILVNKTIPAVAEEAATVEAEAIKAAA